MTNSTIRRVTHKDSDQPLHHTGMGGSRLYRFGLPGGCRRHILSARTLMKSYCRFYRVLGQIYYIITHYCGTTI